MRVRRMHPKRYLKCICCIFIVFMFWTVLSYLFSFKNEDFPDDVVYDIFIDETKEDHQHIPLNVEILEELQRTKNRKKYDKSALEDPSDPVILWWTEFTGEPGQSKLCGQRRCFFTNNRKYSTHKNMRAYLFYGTDFSIKDLPLPRSHDHLWALFHEESPKNNYLLCHEDSLSLFNYTSTFRRESDFPISTQHLPSLSWLQQKTYLKNISQKNSYQEEEGLAPVIYVQSDCDPPSDRDEFVKLLMNYVPVDSYGGCLNNRQIPKHLSQPIEGMSHKDFYELISRYKFALSMENAVCEDYMTEKLWRPLMVGTVPIVFGSSRVKDFLPSKKSALVLTDYKSAEQVGAVLQYLNKNDAVYEEYRQWKNTGISNPFLQDVMTKRTWTPDMEGHRAPDHKNFIESYECFICDSVHQNMDVVSEGQILKPKWANSSHYGCQKPMKFDSVGRYNKDGGWLDFWGTQWERKGQVSSALRRCVEEGRKYCGDIETNEPVKRDFK
ncbi:alpha-(1,3)-fucosyltransferase 10-like [Physella acuta]|uniref:alpha-(1,3)-fucosyltransferase 10-like n=1 Tax=Physella acuta TaxID=109671 RepID=UPI0027DC2AA0|nr:alpha-(1,3)-fucosyltransferase 10-like [Physella acuta]XP_059142727.1 alpha-(1,3)-fucosyltransferase 10-like [Physella acuta]